MASINGAVVIPGLWQEARNADGRVYYYNTQTKVTQWTKPPELMAPSERALANQPWKEYSAEGGRKYWYNTETKQSSWEMPQIYKDALAQDQPPARPSPSQTFVAGGSASLPSFQHEPVGVDRQIGFGNSDLNGGRNSLPQAQHSDPDYASFEEAEAAFLKLLRRTGVQPDWSWEQALRAVIKDPQYRALKDPRDRKNAFEKYAIEMRVQEKDRAKERLAKLRADFGTMLRSHPEIKHYTRWKTARPIIEGETIFRSTNDDNERRQLFEEYVIELKKKNVEREASERKAAMDEIVSILRAMDLEPYTRWSEAQTRIQSNERIQSEDKFKALSKSDILTAFENHIKSLERSFNDARQQQKNSKARRERHNRENFIQLLKELRASGEIKAGTKWMNIHPLIENDERYTAMLGQPGSTPLDLFWDMVEEEERGLRGKRNEVLDVLDDKRYEIQQKTTFDDFMSIMHTDRRTARLEKDALRLIFERLHEKAIRRSEDDKHLAERHQRRAVDALRSRIKRLEPPVEVADSWEQVRSRIQKLEEYVALESDDLRRTAFDKVQRRLKEKEEDNDRDRSRRARDSYGSDKGVHRDRDRDRDRDRTRDRDRDARNGHSSHRGGRHSRRSRSPEPDAYEAERRKAQAERERQYKKASNTVGLSPPHHRSEHDSRSDRDRDRAYARPGSTHYDRERREREEEREKLYRTRGEAKGSKDELEYGERRSPAGRRRVRADSDVESVGSRRDSKRSRRERSPRKRTVSPPAQATRRTKPAPRAAAPKPTKDEPAIHSGSEEGEIEEE
ncbi:MAG: hypothetical protein M1825_004285 [Sarcosagium campestre]|nr:MAG: hypothetical protein M1825_004285 [Sarcosagium campestre]